jgi:uncharacterized protein YjbJ (UPF0337 family)
MDKNRVKGAAKQVAGKIQEGAGRATGSDEHIARGKGKQVEGKVQEGVGKVKDAGRAAAKKLH